MSSQNPSVGALDFSAGALESRRLAGAGIGPMDLPLPLVRPALTEHPMVAGRRSVTAEADPKPRSRSGMARPFGAGIRV